MPIVVIIDDRITNRRILSELATTIESEVQVESFDDPLAALTWVEENTPDLVITDYKMPNINGAEFVRRFRHLPFCFDVPVMVITIYEDKEFRYKALEAGATDFLLSPVDHHEFRARSRNLLALRMQQQIIKNRAYSLEQKLAQDHRTLESVLHESRERLRAVIDAVPAMIYACDVDQRFLFMNDYTAALAGTNPESAIGRTVVEVFGKTTGAKSQSYDLRVLNSGEVLPPFEETMIDAEGQDRVLLTTKCPIADGSGKTTMVVTAALDISGRKQAERKLLEAVREAEIANRAKTEFLANMSHELRTPLNAIIGFSQIMAEQSRGPMGNETYTGYSKDINNSAVHLLGIINEILDLSRIESGRITIRDEEIDLYDAIDDVVRITRPRAAEANLDVVCKLPKGLPLLVADRIKFKQMLLNLLSNAIKFTPAGGRIEIAVQPSDGIRVSVADTGIGMSEEEIPLAVSRFGQVEGSLARSHAGAGLGLSIVTSLMELHGGRCEIESQKAVGTTVTLHFSRERLSKIAKRA